VKMTQRRMARPSLGGLMATRQGALMLALLCAVCAAGILVFALGKYKSGLKTVTQQATVLVATGDIPRGAQGSSLAARGLYKPMPVVPSQIAPGALSDASYLQGKTASTTILPGQQLSVADFTGVVGVTGLLTPNQRAISLAISESPGNNDVLQPGDRVDVYTYFPKRDVVVLTDPDVLVLKSAAGPASTSASSGGTANAPSTATTGTATAGGSGTPAGGAAGSPSIIAGTALVLSVSSQEASNIVYAAETGQTYLTLRPIKSTTTPRPLTTLASVIKDSVASTIPVPPGGVK
jgi:Flp pilus assembly protein CpaB